MKSIRSIQEYEQAKKQILLLQQLRRHTEKLTTEFGIDEPAHYILHIDRSIRDLENVMRSYDECKRNDPGESLQFFHQLPSRLVSIRIWLGWTQVELGKRAGLDSKLIHWYEKNNYARANLEKVSHIVKAPEEGVSIKRELDSARKKTTTVLVQSQKGSIANPQRMRNSLHVEHEVNELDALLAEVEKLRLEDDPICRDDDPSDKNEYPSD
ncbi:hypothetical protein KF913_20230 [Candidatus Obscuribacterales bacterium]|nr:hypothetical protein [Candidatus Obscuribacterales bacterium]